MPGTALIPHPDLYQGATPPDWDRFLERLREEQLVNRLLDWLDGYRSAFASYGAFHGNSSAVVSAARVNDYAFVRDMLRGRGYGEMIACRVALRATQAIAAPWERTREIPATTLYQPL